MDIRFDEIQYVVVSKIHSPDVQKHSLNCSN